MAENPFSMDGFLSNIKGGLPKQNLFTVEFSVPNVFSSTGKDNYAPARNLTWMVQTTSLPGRSFATQESRTNNGPVTQVPYDTIFNEMAMTIILSQDMNEKIFLDQWMGLIHDMNGESKNFHYFTDINTNIIINQLGYTESGKFDIIYKIKLENVYPKTMEPMTLDMGSHEYHTLGISFVYSHWSPENFQSDKLENAKTFNKISNTWNKLTGSYIKSKQSAIESSIVTSAQKNRTLKLKRIIMALSLPKIVVPNYELTLPSAKQKIEYRPFLVKEEKILLQAIEGKDSKEMVRALRQITKNCLITELDVDKLPTFDLEYIFLKLRAVSAGEKVDLRFRNRNCPNKEPDENGERVCDKIIEIPIDLNTIEVQETEGHNNKIILQSTPTEIGMILKHPTIEVAEKIGNIETNDFDSLIKVITHCVEMIFEGETIYESKDMKQQDLVDFLEQLTQENFVKIRNFFETQPRFGT